MKISYGKNVYGKEEINAVVNQLKKTTQMGPSVVKFENSIAKYFSKKYGLMVNSGSSAIMLAIKVLGLKKGDEVIAPCLNFGTAISSLMHYGVLPVFVDIEISSLQININQIQKKITKKTKALMIPNLIGNIPDWVKIRKIANKYNLKIIEDSADTLGAKINGVSSGHYSDMSITSFYGSHIINCAGNGGALTLNNKKAIERAKLLRSWGRSSSLFDEKSEAIENRFNIKLGKIDYDAKFVFETIGYNLEGSEIGAAFGLVQLKNLNKNIKIRQKNFMKQCNFFKKYEKYFTNPEEIKNASTAWLAFPVLIKENAPFSRKDFQIYLEKQNIQTRVVFTGNILRQPMMKNVIYKGKLKELPNSDNVMKKGVLLPVHHGMTDAMFKRLHKTIDSFIEDFT